VLAQNTLTIKTQNESNGSPELDIVAPGQGIRSLNLNDDFTYKSGTSMATPHVSGEIALMLQVNSELTPLEIRTILHDSSIGLGSSWATNLQGHGRVDVQAAINMIDGVEPIPDPEPEPEPIPEIEFFFISKNSDFSTDDRDFETTDTVYMLISSNLVDSLNMKKAEYKIQDSNKVKLQGKLTLNSDGNYAASVSLADLNSGAGKVELKLEDNTRVKFQVRENITIS